MKSLDKNFASAEPTRKSTTRQALYRNYRPRAFKELVGQDHITTTLVKAIKAGRISHAYLFTGPRGVGKTSAARILAHAANDLSYQGESVHLDIIEIDAASNRRIDEIRDLRDKVSIAPTTGKYKVYIIDEVHMLTREAFNALLKTLEEPPAHVIFILATTEAHKLPETIISRTQRFEFKPIPNNQLANHLQKIAKSEKIDITPEALNLLAEFGAGSFRDSISLLDQLSGSDQPIDAEAVQKMLGLPGESAINDLINQLERSDSAAVINSLQQLREQGIDANAIASALAKKIRQQIIGGQAQSSSLNLLKQLIEVPANARPYDFLEICLLEATQAGSKNVAPTKDSLVKPKPDKKVAATMATMSTKIDKPISNLGMSVWPQIIENCREQAASVYTALKLAEPDFQDGTLLLKFQFPLHQKKLLQAQNKMIVARIIEEITGQKVKIECIVDKSSFGLKPTVSNVKATPKNDHVNSISSIFGTAEVVEG